MSNFLQRVITGLLFVIIIIGSIWVHPLAYAAVFLLVAGLAMKELKTMLEQNNGKLSMLPSLLLGTTTYLLIFFQQYYHMATKWMLLLIPLVWLPFVLTLFSKKEYPFRVIGMQLLIPLYAAIPFAFLHFMAFINNTYDPRLLIAFFVMVWINDSGAYLVGVNFGKRRLFERISPKKSWEGFIGGIFFTIVAAVFLQQWVQIGSVFLWGVVGAVIAVFGTVGDLVESMLKRNVNIKDSGSVLPGHGGILDRFDGVLFTAPLVCLLFYLFANF
ncbi:phosphatidate cytidylyltransferase [Marinilabiliaceae bacterium JC017]|nr:phosphatidate cytidylyltransferase [Marinilabiliaceae bacterium JC017]